MIKRKSTAVILAALFLFGHKYVMAGPGADVDGHVWSGTTPLCALVLANGQSMFSCNPNGPFELSHVPLDGDGQVEVQIFVAGFAPFKQKITPSGAVSTVSLPQVNMLRVEQGRSFQVDATYVPSAKVGFVIVAGTVKAGGAPICTLVLANGQKLFTCNENLGKFSLEAPADQDGNVTLMIFAGGFQPYRVIAQADSDLDSDNDGVPDGQDEDDDNDGIFDADDACPLDPNLNCNPVPISGFWSGIVNDSSGPGQMTWVLTQSGTTFSGTVAAIDNNSGIDFTGTVSGTVSGSNFSFTLEIPQGGINHVQWANCSVSASGMGTMSSSSLTGSYSGSNTCSGSFYSTTFSLSKQ